MKKKDKFDGCIENIRRISINYENFTINILFEIYKASIRHILFRIEMIDVFYPNQYLLRIKAC